MPPVQVRSIVAKRAERGAEIAVKISLADGSVVSVLATAPDRPAAWVAAGGGFSFGKPALFLRGLADGDIQAGASALAQDLGGYWLRYYNSLGRAAKAGPAKPAPVDEVSIAGGSVVEVRLKDGRLFSLLSATPEGFAEAMSASGLDFYWGPCPLFLRAIEPALARRAVSAIAAHGDRWLCAYDTPRRTLEQVLSEFKARHA